MINPKTIINLCDEVVSNCDEGVAEGSDRDTLLDVEHQRCVVRESDGGQDQISVRVVVERLSYYKTGREGANRDWWLVERRYTAEDGASTTEILEPCRTEAEAVDVALAISLAHPDWTGIVIRHHNTMRPSGYFGHFGFKTPKLRG